MEESTPQAIAAEVAKQLKADQLLAFSPNTNGLTQRDLIIEMRTDIKNLHSTVHKIEKTLPRLVSVGQLLGAAATAAGLAVSYVALFM